MLLHSKPASAVFIDITAGAIAVIVEATAEAGMYIPVGAFLWCAAPTAKENFEKKGLLIILREITRINLGLASIHKILYLLNNRFITIHSSVV